jgi:hypothetical protein
MSGFQGMCLVAEEGSRTIDHFDVLPSAVRQLFRETATNLCTICAADLVTALTDRHPSYAPIQTWLQVIRLMERSITNGTDPRTELDYLRCENNARQYSDLRPRWGSQDYYPGTNRQNLAYAADLMSRIQQEDRYRDGKAAAWARFLQDYERDRT